MTTQKVGILRPKKDFWTQKSFFGPPKTQKIDFLKKPQLRDLTKHLVGSHNSPGHLGTIRPHGTIQKVSTLLWPSVT